AKFTILFPRLTATDAAESAAPPVKEQTPQRTQSIRRILVVDDEPAIRSLLAEILESSGLEVITAQDGREARDQASRHSLDLVITDLIMPEVEGIEFIAKLRKERKDLKLIAMSGLFSADMLSAARLLGAHATLTKPLTAGMVLDCIEGLGAARSC